ncbi:MAG: hypothetical protein H6Q73_3307 [Firmicutes bacterium]|nr:hypothetical protein [Bacillota bacterium]
MIKKFLNSVFSNPKNFMDIMSYALYLRAMEYAQLMSAEKMDTVNRKKAA